MSIETRGNFYIIYLKCLSLTTLVFLIEKIYTYQSENILPLI